MNAQIDPVRSRHPAVVAALGVGGVAFTACALLVIAYMLDWLPSKPQLPSAPSSMANPGQQVAGSAPDVALLPGETLVAPPDTPQRAPAASAMTAPPAQPRPTAARPAEPRYATTPSQEPAKTPAAPGKPNYTRDELAARTSGERSSDDVCVNCGAITSIGSSGPDWEVRVRFDDGSSESLRYTERPRLRIGDRVHLEDGKLVRD